MKIIMVSKGREEDRVWREECPYCDFSVPDGYGYCENCGEPTNGWWEQVEKGEVFTTNSDTSPCDGIADIAVEKEKPLVLRIEENLCVSPEGRKKVGETHYLRVPVMEGDSEEVIENRAMEKFFRELC